MSHFRGVEKTLANPWGDFFSLPTNSLRSRACQAIKIARQDKRRFLATEAFPQAEIMVLRHFHASRHEKHVILMIFCVFMIKNAFFIDL